MATEDLWAHGSVQFATCICHKVDTSLSKLVILVIFLEFWTSLDTSILLFPFLFTPSIDWDCNLILPLTTNMTMTLSTLQTSRSWVAIFDVYLPIGFLSCTWDNTPLFLVLWIFTHHSKKTSKAKYIIKWFISSLRRFLCRFGEVTFLRRTIKNNIPFLSDITLIQDFTAEPNPF